MVWSAGHSQRLGAFHAPRLSSIRFRQSRPHCFSRTCPRQGQRHDWHGARTARARSDQRAGGGDRPGHALHDLRRTDEDQRGLLGDPSSRRVVDLFSRSQDADLQAEAGRQVPGNGEPFSSKDVKFSFERFGARIRPTRTRRFSPRSRRSRRPTQTPWCSISRTRAIRRCFTSAMKRQ